MIDAVNFDEVWERASHGLGSSAISTFVHFMEGHLGVRVVYDNGFVPFQNPELLSLCSLAERLKEREVIYSYWPASPMPDEIPFHLWSADCVRGLDFGEPITSGGASLTSDHEALTIALAEAVERHVWASRIDYLGSLTIETTEEIDRLGNAIAPERFAGFSKKQREGDPRLSLSPERRYAWVRGQSWISNGPTWLPAQTISGSPAAQAPSEPMIRQKNTTGCAAYPTREGAVLNGALEVIERDAYMITWLNQLSPPRFDLHALAKRSETLARLLELSARYRFRPHVVRLPTDAPTYAVCAVVEDESGRKTPAVSLGLKAHRDLAVAAAGALAEALRIRQTARSEKTRDELWDPKRRTADIGHFDRLFYWMEDDRSSRLAFLTNGPVKQFEELWEKDSDTEHLARIVGWCRERGYEFVSVSMTKSAGNPTPWHLETVVIPELQPMHLSEKHPHVGGSRLATVPKMFGYKSREPYVADPHPFA